MELLTKKDLVAKVAAECNVSKKTAAQVYDSIITTIGTEVIGGKRVMLRGIGTLKVKNLKARTIKTFGKEFNLPARKKISLSKVL